VVVSYDTEKGVVGIDNRTVQVVGEDPDHVGIDQPREASFL
jgi:hypothetical protein